MSRGAGRPASLYQFDAKAFAPYKDKPLVFILIIIEGMGNSEK